MTNRISIGDYGLFDTKKSPLYMKWTDNVFFQKLAQELSQDIELFDACNTLLSNHHTKPWASLDQIVDDRISKPIPKYEQALFRKLRGLLQDLGRHCKWPGTKLFSEIKDLLSCGLSAYYLKEGLCLYSTTCRRKTYPRSCILEEADNSELKAALGNGYDIDLAHAAKGNMLSTVLCECKSRNFDFRLVRQLLVLRYIHNQLGLLSHPYVFALVKDKDLERMYEQALKKAPQSSEILTYLSPETIRLVGLSPPEA